MQEKRSQSKIKKSLSLVLKVAISAALIYFLLYISNLEDLKESFRSVSLLTVVVSISLYFASLYFSTKRWQVILRGLEINVQDKELYKSYLIGAFFNNFLPSSIGGDVSKVFTVVLKKGEKIKFGASIVAERLAGVFTNLILGVLFGLFLIKDDKVIMIVWLILLVCFVIALGILFINKQMRFAKIFKIFPERVRTKIKDIARDIASINLDKRELLSMFAYSCLICLTSVISLNFYLNDLGHDILLAPLFFMISSTMILSLIPISLNSIGIKEFGYVAILGLYGVARADALTIALVSRVLLILCSLVGGILLLLKRDRSVH